MKLTIAIVTWNRADQIKVAIESCFKCNLPQETQFVVIDNASTDCTENAVKELFIDNRYILYYEKLPENIGCGNGRNYAYQKCLGEYMYCLDDDAYIDTSKNKDFFIKAIDILDRHKEIATLTTQIYDNVWESNRVEIFGREITPDLHRCLMFCGGSHFLRRSYFGNKNPYYANKYGYEEVLPSFKVYNDGCINAFAPNLLIIHNPKFDKWKQTNSANIELLAKGLILKAKMKLKVFPLVYKPFVYLAMVMRIVKSKWALKVATQSILLYRETKILPEQPFILKFNKVKELYEEFGFSIF